MICDAVGNGTVKIDFRYFRKSLYKNRFPKCPRWTSAWMYLNYIRGLRYRFENEFTDDEKAIATQPMKVNGELVFRQYHYGDVNDKNI